MKKFYSWMSILMLVCSFGFTSCDPKDEVKPEAPAPELLEFSFQADKNAGVISDNYTGVISTTDQTVKVTMPAFADKSALVASFKVGEGNTVTVNGVPQESCVTANDFSVPVDYIISNADGTKNVKFTVTVEKAADYVWTEVARYTEVVPRAKTAVLKLNPTNNVPYIAFVDKTTNKVIVIKNASGAFEYVGTKEGESSLVTTGRMDFTMSNDGTPYFIYADGSITDPVKSAATVMKFNGTAWGNVGNPGIAGFVPSKVMIGVIGNNVVAPMVANANLGSFVKRNIYCSVFDNAWATSSLENAGVTDAYVSAFSVVNNVGYLYSISSADYKYSVSEYRNGAWTSLRKSYLPDGATQAPILMADAASITAANDGTVYVLTADDAETGDVKDMRFRVMQYNPATKEWTMLGGSTISSVKADSTKISAKLAVAPDGTVFLAYTDSNGDTFAKVQYFDKETKQWSEPVAVSAEAASGINIQFCDNGEAYITFHGTNDAIVLMKYAAKK